MGQCEVIAFRTARERLVPDDLVDDVPVKGSQI